MNRVSRLRFWWRSVWGASMAAFGRQRPSRFTFTATRPGPPVDWARVKWPPWIKPPEDEIGVAAGTRAIIYQSDQLVIGLVDCVAYSTGFEFAISLLSRNRLMPHDLGLGSPDTDEERSLVVGIQFPDGQAAEGERRHGPQGSEFYKATYEGREPVVPKGPVVMPKSGGGGERRYEFRYWCWPLPPDGTMTVSVSWRAAGVAPTSAVVDASAIHRAGIAGTSVWPA